MVGLFIDLPMQGDATAAFIMPISKANMVECKLVLTYYEELFSKLVQIAQVITDDCGNKGRT
jgi:hypothetical protein